MANRVGVGRFREQWKAGKPGRAALQWARIKGYADANGLTERGRFWLGLGGATRRPTPLSRVYAVRKAGGTRAWQALQARLLLSGDPDGGRGSGRNLDGGPAQPGGGDGGRLREMRPRSPARRFDGFREWAARQVRSGARVDSGAAWRELRAENKRRCGL